jgi:tetratricopeptide (TPR) repeat protein
VRAEALLKLKRYEEAARYFGHYLEKGKPVTEVFQGRALAHAGRGNYAAAAEDYTQALACRPGDAPVLAARGWMYIANDAARLAQRDFTEVIRLDPKSGDAYNGRGYALARLGRHVEAARDVREALSRGPKSPRLLFNAARAFAQAAGAVRAEPGSPLDRTRIQTVYREESLFCLAEALALIPKGERRAFWQTYVALDSALNPIRPFPGFVRLAEPYQKPVRIVEGAQP